ncbi:MAG: hypothetical protein CM15mP120_00310 [Pseudomonadota bacterium]|nr:MAG: hypothetical protein CM15mP120_00310 [Pseudomonadota bacterium]
MNYEEFQQIEFKVQDRVALVTLNRPEQMNTWTPIMSRELSDAMYECDENDDIRAVVVTGAGRAFCAGADLSGGRKALPAKPPSQGHNCGPTKYANP